MNETIRLESPQTHQTASTGDVITFCVFIALLFALCSMSLGLGARVVDYSTLWKIVLLNQIAGYCGKFISENISKVQTFFSFVFVGKRKLVAKYHKPGDPIELYIYVFTC